MKAVVLALICALLISTGQVLWKISIDKNGGLVKPGIPLVQNFIQLFISPYMLVGIFVYGIATIFWMYLLGKFEYSYIYPMLAMVYVFFFILRDCYI